MTDSIILDRAPRRTPSLREIRRNCPENVHILPTAQARQVIQKSNRDRRKAAVQLRKRHGDRFGYIHPHRREALRRAKLLREAEKSPATLILDSLIKSLGSNVVDRVILDLDTKRNQSDNPLHQQAYELARLSLPIPYGEWIDLQWAMDQFDD